MKITILSDIHGNLPALQAVLRHARGRLADQTIINLGDLVGYGPEPEAVVRWSQGANIFNLLGDYDQKVLSKKNKEAGWSKVKNPEKRAMFAWTYHALSKRSRKILKSYPETRTLEFGGLRLFCSHSGTKNSSDYLGPNTPDEILEEIAVKNDADILLFGHSHKSLNREVSNVLFINPGSVGRLDDGIPLASYAILEINEGQAEVEIYRVPYNLTSAVDAIRKKGLAEIFAQIIQEGLNYDDIKAKFGETLPGMLPHPNGIMAMLTDFGISDHFIGVMKGVILEIAPHTKFVDISHQVRPQDVMRGARLLSEALPYFSPGTVFVAVVDPGVGTHRRAIAARVGTHYFVAPDNGLLTFVIQHAQEQGESIDIVDLKQPQYWLPNPSRSFHGRDIFAPVGAHLVNGLPLTKLGEPITDPVLLTPPLAQQMSDGWLGEVVMIDTFGNLGTNLPLPSQTAASDRIIIEIQEEQIHGLTPTFGDALPGNLIATIDSSGLLAISVVNGSAKKRLGADIGTPVRMIF